MFPKLQLTENVRSLTPKSSDLAISTLTYLNFCFMAALESFMFVSISSMSITTNSVSLSRVKSALNGVFQ